MTTPIPESAVEAAAMAVHMASDYPFPLWSQLVASDDKANQHRAKRCRDYARAALTAARPLMEDEAKAEAWDEGADWHHRANPVERIRRLTVGQGNPYRAATIAERTQR